MRFCTAAAIALLATTRLSAQEMGQQPGHDRTGLDSGTVVCPHWKDGTEKPGCLHHLGLTPRCSDIAAAQVRCAAHPSSTHQRPGPPRT